MVIRVTREAYDVVILMKAGLGSVRIAKALGIGHGAVLSRQNTLEKLGVISKGATPESGVKGEPRRVLLADSEFSVEAEHRGTIAARAAADRSDAATREARRLSAQERRDARRASKQLVAA